MGTNVPPSFVIHILDSPRTDERAAGIDEGKKLQTLLDAEKLEIMSYPILNFTAFAEAIGTIAARHLTTETIPILHLSMHGNDEEIGLADGHTIKWHALIGYIYVLSRAIDRRVLVCMSACEGFSAISMACLAKTLPFFALVGPATSPSWNEAAAGYAAFYKAIARGKTIPEAVDEMNSAVSTKVFNWKGADEAQKELMAELAKQPSPPIDWLQETALAATGMDRAWKSFADTAKAIFAASKKS